MFQVSLLMMMDLILLVFNLVLIQHQIAEVILNMRLASLKAVPQKRFI